MYINELKERIIILEETIKTIEGEAQQFPSGNLRIQKKRNTQQYYHVTEKDDTHGSFIKAENSELAEKLAQKSYYEKLLRELQREYNAISCFLNKMEGKKPEEVYSSMNDYRKKLVKPLFVTDKEYVTYWEAQQYTKNPFRPEECTQPTEKGEKVRSKSEARIADMYYSLGIPYRYEAQVVLKNGKEKYPDFTLLKLPERVLYYHEHMGLMEDDFYRKNNLIKLKEYSESNIFVGKNLILTFESDYAPLDIKTFRKNIIEIFRWEYN